LNYAIETFIGLISPKVLFHDADGCLNLTNGLDLADTAGSLSAAEIEALNHLGQRIDASPLEHLVINTGRSWAATRFICSAIASPKLSYALVEHGAELWDVVADCPVDLHAVASESANAQAVSALASTEKVSGLIRWFEEAGRSQLCEELGYSGVIEPTLDKNYNLTFLLPLEMDGDRAVATLRKLIATQPEFVDEPFVYHHSRWNRYLDVMGSMDKGIGLSLTMHYLGFDVAQSAAIGDGLNDMPMLQTAGVPICPTNAEAAVRELCRDNGYVSSSAYIGATYDWLALLAG